MFTSRNVNRFANCEWSLSADNQPIIANCAGVLECKTYQTVDAGDHLIIIREVTNLQNNEKEPLLYHKRKFGPIPTEFL